MTSISVPKEAKTILKSFSIRLEVKHFWLSITRSMEIILFFLEWLNQYLLRSLFNSNVTGVYPEGMRSPGAHWYQNISVSLNIIDKMPRRSSKSWEKKIYYNYTGTMLILIVREVIFHPGKTHNRRFRGVFRGSKTFLIPKLSWAHAGQF